MPANHRFVSAKPDSGDTSVVRPQADWNDSHVFSGGTNGQMLIRDDTQTDGWRWENPARRWFVGLGRMGCRRP